ncbi:hypothetical protein [Roseibium sp.]|uniref:hypothetical protein n=1 Tax=Roseibium sp. TaxID=1936156 RepID=UPI003B51AA2A
MKRYLTFGFFRCEPSGGWEDFQGEFESLEEARAHVGTLLETKGNWIDSVQVVDRETNEVVFSQEQGFKDSDYCDGSSKDSVFRPKRMPETSAKTIRFGRPTPFQAQG